MSHDADDDEILSGFGPDTPFGVALEQWLDATGGPVPADSRVARRAAESLRGDRHRRWWRRVVGVGVAAAAVLTLALADRPTVDTVQAPEHPEWIAVIEAPSTSVVRTVEALRITDGAVRLPGSPGRGRVEVGDWILEAEAGADWVVGAHGGIAAVGVLHGVVRFDSGEELPAGNWQLGEGGRRLAFGEERPPDWTQLEDPEAARWVLTRLRWLALPEDTRAGVMP